jgi:SOS-response transcriptional repressor LexA
MTGETSEAARRLKLLREQAGISMRAAAEHLGWTITRYQHYEDRYRRRFLPIELARALAELFAPRGIEPAVVMELAGVGPGQPLARLATGGFEAASALAPAPAPAAPRDLPVMGAVKGGTEGFYFNEGEPKEYVPRPASLAGAANGFALYVDGDSMEPRYFAGELVYVNPNRPLTKGCFVAVEMKDGQGLIKQFLKRSDEHVALRQFNPPKDLRLHARDVKQVYRITGSAEG